MNTEQSSPKDVFAHLLAVVMLYTSAISFLVLVFQYVNIALPDTVELTGYARQGALSAMRAALATLVVVFPVYIAVTWWLNKGYAAFPFLRQLKTRKWLVYGTLFVAALVIISDLVTLLYTFLEGDIAARFLIKVAAVFFVAVSIFGYYLYDIRKKAESV